MGHFFSNRLAFYYSYSPQMIYIISHYYFISHLSSFIKYMPWRIFFPLLCMIRQLLLAHYKGHAKYFGNRMAFMWTNPSVCKLVLIVTRVYG